MSQKNCSLAIDENSVLVQEDLEAFEPELIFVKECFLRDETIKVEGKITVSF